MITVAVRHDPERRRFVATLPDQSEAELRYRQQGAVLDFYHTYVPEVFRTQGIAEQVVAAGFVYARQQGCRVVPSCPYVSRGFLRRHPEYQNVVDPGPGGPP